MRLRRYEPFEGSVQVSLHAAATLGAGASVEFFVNAPLVGRVIVQSEPRAPAWLRERMRAQVSAALFLPSFGCPIWSAVVRCGFYDREVGDVPIAWEWYSDGRVIDRAAERRARRGGDRG